MAKANLNVFSKLFSSKKKEKAPSKDTLKKELKKLKSDSAKIRHLKEVIKDEEKKDIAKDAKKELAELLKKPVVEYHLTYDSFTEGLEPVYFWILDFIKEMKYEVNKTKEDFEASVGSAYFGDIGTRASVMQDRAMKLMATINTLIRSIINLIYDLKEFDIRMDIYDELESKNKEEREAAEIALRGVYMDQVDIKKGRGSINMLTQNLQFVTLRDAFLYPKNLKEVEKMDLNDRVKRILKARLTDYFKWRKYSEKELRKRREIERQYLKSQVGSLKLYVDWAKPYFRAAQKLGMKDFDSPNIISVFNNMELEVSLLGEKKLDIKGEIDKGYLPIKAKSEKDIYSMIEVEFKFRGVPHTTRQAQSGMQYTQGGKVDVIIKGFVVDEDDLKLLKNQELYEGITLVEEMLDTSLEALQEDLDKYTSEEEDEEEKKKKTTSGDPFTALFNSFKPLLSPLKLLPRSLRSSTKNFAVSNIKSLAEDNVKGSSFTLYDVYKKAHGMLSW